MIFRMKGAIHHLELTAPANSSLKLAAGSCELITTPTHESALIHDEACHAFSTVLSIKKYVCVWLYTVVNGKAV